MVHLKVRGWIWAKGFNLGVMSLSLIHEARQNQLGKCCQENTLLIGFFKGVQLYHQLDIKSPVCVAFISFLQREQGSYALPKRI